MNVYLAGKRLKVSLARNVVEKIEIANRYILRYLKLGQDKWELS